MKSSPSHPPKPPFGAETTRAFGPARKARRGRRADRRIGAKARDGVERGRVGLRVEEVLDVEREVEAAMLVTDMQIELRPPGHRDDAVVRRGPIADAVEAKARAEDARSELVSHRQTAGPRLLRRERERAGRVAVVHRERRVREGHVEIGGEPLRDLEARLELGAVAVRRIARRGRAVVAVPHGLAREVEHPERGREVPPIEESRAHADLLADRAHERRHRGRREDAAHVVRVIAVPVVEIEFELRVLLRERRHAPRRASG